MKIQNILQIFHNEIITSTTPIPFFNPEEGVKILLPFPYSVKPGSIFIGSMSDWESIYTQQWLHDGCTYLVCCRNQFPQIPHLSREINLIFLDSSLKNAKEKLTALFTQQQTHPDSARIYHTFWNKILSMDITTQEQIREYTSLFPYPLKRHLACIVVVSFSEHVPAATITEELQTFFPETNIYHTENEWIIFYSQTKDTSDTLDISYEDFSALLEKYNLDAGISYSCQLPEILRTLYLTAAASIELGKKLSIPPYIKHIYTYHQYNPHYIVHLCTQGYIELHQTKNLLYLAHPDIVRLYYYDINNNNNLLEVLYTYLVNGKNLLLTAQALFMHRNTVMNKLKRIESFLQHKIDYNQDHLLLLLSCIILRYQHNYSQHKITDLFHIPAPPDSDPTE